MRPSRRDLENLENLENRDDLDCGDRRDFQGFQVPTASLDLWDYLEIQVLGVLQGPEVPRDRPDPVETVTAGPWSPARGPLDPQALPESRALPEFPDLQDQEEIKVCLEPRD